MEIGTIKQFQLARLTIVDEQGRTPSTQQPGEPTANDGPPCAAHAGVIDGLGQLELKLDQINCYDEADGAGTAEPYLWTVFFKVDGDTLVVNSDGPVAPFLQGAPTVVGTPGNHGNLGTRDVDAGEEKGRVPVPAIIGEYRTIMKPIPLTTPILGMSEVGGMIGCVVVLMEENNTPASAVVRGHDTLDSQVRDKLAAVLGTLSISKSEPTDEDIAALTDQIKAP